MTHEFSIPLNGHEFAHHENSGYISWPFPEHHENPITSQIHEPFKKVMAFSCALHCISYNLDCFMAVMLKRRLCRLQTVDCADRADCAD